MTTGLVNTHIDRSIANLDPGLIYILYKLYKVTTRDPETSSSHAWLTTHQGSPHSSSTAVDFVNIVNQDEVAHDEPPLLDLHFLPSL